MCASNPRACDSNGESVLGVGAAGLDALVAKNALGIIADVEIIVDLHRLMHIGGLASEPFRMRVVPLDVWLRLRGCG
jgi:hypothetical protein